MKRAILIFILEALALPVFVYGQTTPSPEPTAKMPSFIEESSIPEGKALIYIYRVPDNSITGWIVPLVFQKAGL